MAELSNQLITYVTFAYMAAAVLYLIAAVSGARRIALVGSGLTWLILAVHTTAIILRWVGSYEMGVGHAPFSNLFESLVFFGWTLVLIYLILELRTRMYVVGAYALPLVFATMLYALAQDASIRPLMPALKSNWLIAHVIACFLGYAGFGISAALSLLYLLTGQGRQPSSPRANALDNFIYQTVAIGFIMLTAGIITGAVWANSAWGTYWSWDPKETWSLITWFVYAAMLHSRYMRGWQGTRLAVFSLAGFVCVLFTYFGVNLLLSGLHSYAS